MDESDALRLADKMAARLIEPLPHFDASDFQEPLTLRDILRLGFALARTMRSAYPNVQDEFPVPPDLLAAFLAVPSDPERMRNLLYEGLKKTDEDPTGLEDEIDYMGGGMLRRGARREVKEVFRKAWPPGALGPDRKICTEDLPKLADRTELLFPVLVRLPGLQQEFPKKNWEKLVNFFRDEHPRECTYLKHRLERLPRLMELPAFGRAKTTKSKARILADLLVGSDFDLRPRYARQKAEEARRLVRGKQRKRSPRLNLDRDSGKL